MDKVIDWELSKKLKFHHSMHTTQNISCRTPLGFWHTNGSRNLGQTPKSYDNQQKEGACRIAAFAVPAYHWVKLIECEKKDKYIDLARKVKNCGTWKWLSYQLYLVLYTAPTELVQELEYLKITGQVESFQTTVLLRSFRILRRVLETWWDFLSLKLQWKAIS